MCVHVRVHTWIHPEGRRWNEMKWVVTCDYHVYNMTLLTYLAMFLPWAWGRWEPSGQETQHEEEKVSPLALAFLQVGT